MGSERIKDKDGLILLP